MDEEISAFCARASRSAAVKVACAISGIASAPQKRFALITSKNRCWRGHNARCSPAVRRWRTGEHAQHADQERAPP